VSLYTLELPGRIIK